MKLEEEKSKAAHTLSYKENLILAKEIVQLKLEKKFHS